MYKKLRQDLEKQRIEKIKKAIINSSSSSKPAKVKSKNEKKQKTDSELKADKPKK